MLCGNGGSAADSQHMAAEFTSRLRASLERPPIAAIALTTDTSFLTARANDYGFDEVFERLVLGLGQPADVLIGISTSGNSENVVRAVKCCHARNILTVGFLGCSGGKLGSLVDIPIIVPATVRNTFRNRTSLSVISYASWWKKHCTATKVQSMSF